VPTFLSRFNRAVAQFDEVIERKIDGWRGHPTLDRVMYAASEIGDFSLVWHLIGTARSLAPDRRPLHAVRLSALMGVESALVNGLVKSAFGRHRPPWEQERPHRLRRPRTSSFPSGHASSAAMAVGILAQRDPLWPLYAAVGATVASSRVYVKVHHPSDVVAGALLGVLLAAVARQLWPLPGDDGSR
jgi:membrane-associated phospholipid phosphatase